MKKISLTIDEFCNFKKIAEKFKIQFNVSIKKKEVEIEADEYLLTQLGY